MKVKNYINRFIIPIINKEGFIYLSDNYLIVKDKISKRLIELNINEEVLTSRNKLRRIDKLKLILGEISNDDKRFSDLRILIDFQIYLYDLKLDGRYTKQIRSIISGHLKNNKKITKIGSKFYYYHDEINVTLIKSINEYTIQVNKLLSNTKNRIFYRGHSEINHKPIPAIYRNIKWILNEHNMFRDILIRNPEEFNQTKSAFEKLTIMQHYGLPTRLLDISTNPLVALYFACNLNNKPGEVLFFAPSSESIKFYDSDTVSILSNLAKVDRNLNINLDKDEFNNKTSIYEDDKKEEDKNNALRFIHLIKEEKPYFLAEINPNDLKKTLVVKPVNNNERIKRQQGLFILFGVGSNIKQPSLINSKFEINNKPQKIFIEASDKKDIIKELKTIGVSENTLFPEIDYGTNNIKKEYE